MPDIALIVSPNTIDPIDVEELSLFGYRYWVRNGLRKRKISATAPAIRTGNVTFADQQFASEVIWEDLTGGLGVMNMDEREFPDRFTDSSVFTLLKKQRTLLPKRNTVTITGVAFSEIAGAASYRGFTYVAGGARVKRLSGTVPLVEYYDTVGTAWVVTAGTELNMNGVAASSPIVWKDLVWFSQNTGGLYSYDPDNVAGGFTAVTTTLPAPSSAQVKPLFLFIFDEDLAVLDATGGVYSTDDTTPTTTADWTFRGSVDTFEQLNGVVVGRNNLGDPAPWISTDRGLMLHDWWTQKMYQSGIQWFDADTNNGKGITTWDGDVWFGKSGNAHQVVAGARVVRGPNVGDGLLKERQGHIVALNNTFDNFLVAGLNAPAIGRSSVLAYNRKGWHVLAYGSGVGSAQDYESEFGSYAGYAKAGRGVVGQPALDVFDNFNRDHAGALGTSTSGHAWTLLGTWLIQNPVTGDVPYDGQANPNTGVANRTAIIASGVSDGVVKATFDIVVAGTRLIFRYTDVDNYLFVEARASSWRVATRIATVEATLATHSATPANGDKVEVFLSGSSIQVYINDILRITTTSATAQTAASHGLGADNIASAIKADNFMVDGLSNELRFVHVCGFVTPNHLYYNEGSALKFVRLYDYTDNPNQYEVTEFELAGDLILPWFDANLASVQKTALSAQVRVLNASSTETYKLWYQIDDVDTWIQMYDVDGNLATVSASGVTDLYLNTTRAGTLFRNIRFKEELASGSSSLSPRVVFVKLRYIREFNILYGFDFDIDLTRDQPDGRTPQEAIANLETAVGGKQIGVLSYLSSDAANRLDVYITTYGGPVGSGVDKTMTATLSVIEMG
jgi:hypothetical protein